MWILVFIYFYEGTPYVEKIDSYNTMNECFFHRELLGKQQSGREGYFPRGQQAVCIRGESTDT